MPGIHRMNGRNLPYGRVYYNEEGLGNGIANRYGWYYPEFRLASGSHRVVLVGDSFIQAYRLIRHHALQGIHQEMHIGHAPLRHLLG